MNRAAERHIDKAAGYIEKGEGYYARAADEIVAAQAADTTVSNREIGERFGRSKDWVRQLVLWRTTGDSSRQPTPFSGQADAINLRKTRQMLREAPLEQVERMVAALPRARQVAIAAAAGDAYSKARQDHEDRERQRPEQERRAQDQAREQISRPVRQAAAGFTSLGIVGHLEQAAEELRELTADASLTPAVMREIERADAAWREAFDFARALAGGDQA